MWNNLIIVTSDVFTGSKVIVGTALNVNSFMKKYLNVNSKRGVKTISALIFILIRTGIIF